jgi:hypothetical protein
MTILLRTLIFFTLFSSTVYAQTSEPSTNIEHAIILERVKDFYAWALSNSRMVMSLEPRIKNVKGKSKFYLDVSTLNAFSNAFMKSGDFSDDFPSRLEKYYGQYREKFNRYSQNEFTQIQKNGRGPLMETEDMDIFFCAQEYEYAQPFIDDMKLADIKITDKTASATVVSPYNWKTEFQLKKVNQRWLISAYCVYK